MSSRFASNNPCDICTDDYVGCEAKCKKYQEFKRKKKKNISQQRKNSQKNRRYYDDED